MILAFIIGGIFQFFRIDNLICKNPDNLKKIRYILYHIVVIYLLFKIGFNGGKSILSESFNHIVFTCFIAISASVLWTLFLLRLLKSCSPFDNLTQISIATHFGSVSVGTFIAGVQFLSALGVETPNTVVVWLAAMELPALFVGVMALKIKLSNVFEILKKDIFLWVLISSILFGIFGGTLIPDALYTFIFTTIFLPILAYFLFEMGSKASASLKNIKSMFKTLLLFGTLIPLTGGFIGASVGALLNYSGGEIFMLSILMASASYVLVPISLKEILKKTTDTESAEDAIATSMALSVGITLPFNILIGFELYYLYIKFLGFL